MLPLESTTRHVGAGVSGTLKSAVTRRMLLPFSTVWTAIPVLALGPWNLLVVGGPLLASGGKVRAGARVAASGRTDSRRLSFISLLLEFSICTLVRSGPEIRTAVRNIPE